MMETPGSSGMAHALPGGSDVSAARRMVSSRLLTAGRVASDGAAALEARLLVCAALGLTPEDLFRDPARRLEQDEAGRLEALLQRRLAGTPMAHLTGVQEFWSLPFRVSGDTLVPRADSETLIEAVLARSSAPAQVRRILDLGTGTGCLLLSLLTECQSAWGLGVDLDPAAAALAARNARELGLADRAVFVAGNWMDALTSATDKQTCGFDVVISNPPYICHGDIAGLAPEVRDHEPGLALDGGADGLDAIRHLLDALPSVLAPGGLGVIEFGHDQGGDVARLLEAHGGYDDTVFHADLAGHVRCVSVRRESTGETSGAGSR